MNKQDLPSGFPQLATRVLRPDATDEVRVRQAIGDLREPRLAWQALASKGLLPAGWGEAEHRRFHDAGMQVSSFPPTVQALLTLASDRAGVAQAELLALEYYRRLEPWGGARVTRIGWQVLPRCDVLEQFLGPTALSAVDEAFRRLAPKSLPAKRKRARKQSEVKTLMGARNTDAMVCRALTLDARWRAAVTSDETVPEFAPGEYPAAVHGVPFRSLENPFEPIIELFQLGYVLVDRPWLYSPGEGGQVTGPFLQASTLHDDVAPLNSVARTLEEFHRIHEGEEIDHERMMLLRHELAEAISRSLGGVPSDLIEPCLEMIGPEPAAFHLTPRFYGALLAGQSRDELLRTLEV